MKKVFKLLCVNLFFVSVIMSIPLSALSLSNSFVSKSCSALLLQNFKKIKDSSIELEISLNENSVKLITTERGIVGDLFFDEEELPLNLHHYFKTEELNSGAWKYKKIENLPLNIQVEAFKTGIIIQNLEFSALIPNSRKIPNIFVKKEIREKFHLQQFVELANAKSAHDGSMLEFHMRDAIAPGDLALQAKEFQKKMGLGLSSFHMHVVFNQDLEWLRQKPQLHTWRFIEFWRRLNLTMEMRDVFENGRGLIENSDEYRGISYTHFSPLKEEDLNNGFNYFKKLSLRGGSTFQSPALGSQSKMGWVGMWGHDKYDAPDLFGFELRFLTTKDLPANLINYLNHLHEQVETHEFGLSEEKLELWGEFLNLNVMNDSFLNYVKIFMGTKPSMPPSIRNKIYQTLNPHSDYILKFEDLPFSFKKVLWGLNQDKVEELFNKRGRLLYLIHNWRMDPLLFNQSELLEKIEKAQLHALRKWSQNNRKETQIMQEFLLDSGLYNTFAESVGLEL